MQNIFCNKQSLEQYNAVNIEGKRKSWKIICKQEKIGCFLEVGGGNSQLRKTPFLPTSKLSLFTPHRHHMDYKIAWIQQECMEGQKVDKKSIFWY